MSPFWKVFIIIGSLLGVSGIKQFYPDYQDDNIIEETVEEIIKQQTGIDIDLTPLSSEEKDVSPEDKNE